MSNETAKNASPSIRALGLLFGSVVIVATLVPIPVYFLAFVIPSVEHNRNFFADFEDWEPSSVRNIPDPPEALRSELTAAEVFVYVDPWLAGVIYPLWAVLGVAVGGSIISVAVLATPGNTERTSGLRRKHVLLACMVFAAWSAVPFVIAYVVVAVSYVRMFGGF